MAFQTPITIREAVNNIAQRKYVLPAIQRELVWTTSQIERLFDSLMRDYPVGSFLFWYVERHRTKDYEFYEFIKNYHERKNRHNRKADVDSNNDIIAILDGQQRLTSMYIGLKGSYAYKEPRKRWDNDLAFPERKLYLNLLDKSREDDLEYDFRFLTANEAQQSNSNTYWFRVGDILDFKEEYEINDYLINNGLFAGDKEKSQFANRTLFKLYAVVNNNPVINYFLERDESLDKVLNIFIRVNSGGTPLSYSDLLLSIATAQWQYRDAREEITSFVEEINNTGDGFRFDKDFVLKTCLVLSDIPDIAFKVDNFNKANMLEIEENWEAISQAIRLSVILVSHYGYSRDTLTSNNALIPIAYYLLRKGLPHNFDLSSAYRDDREKIQRWLILSLLKRAFSGQPDTVLRPTRQVLAQNYSTFPLDELIERFRGSTKSLVFNEDELRNLFFYRYGESYTFSTLALLYPTLDFRNKFHMDHIYPRSLFTRHKLLRRGIPESKLESYLSEFDNLANLQLLEGVPNQQKSDMDFKEWLYKAHPSEQERNDYMRKHYIPNVELSFDNFDQFIEERKKLMSEKFRSILAPATTTG